MLLLTSLWLQPEINIIRAQQKKQDPAPREVMRSFKRLHPHAEEVQWQAQGENYQVQYSQGDLLKQSLYSPSGKELQTTMPLETDDLPKEVSNYISFRYSAFRIDKVELLDKANRIYYRVAISADDQQTLHLLFDDSGKFVLEMPENETSPATTPDN